jgi:bifunctional ADP-heptose synthase (sugar kinase/adenylyltransferase)
MSISPLKDPSILFPLAILRAKNEQAELALELITKSMEGLTTTQQAAQTPAQATAVPGTAGAGQLVDIKA